MARLTKIPARYLNTVRREARATLAAALREGESLRNLHWSTNLKLGRHGAIELNVFGRGWQAYPLPLAAFPRPIHKELWNGQPWRERRVIESHDPDIYG